MKKKKLLLILQSGFCILLVAMLAAAVLGVYRNGLAQKAADPLSPVYSREKLAAALSPVLPLLGISLAFSLLALVLGIRDERADRGVKDTESLRDLTVSRVAEASADMLAERVRQRKLRLGGGTVFALCMLPILLYVSNAAHFPDGDPEPVLLALMAHVLPWVAMGLAALMISAALLEKSMQREIDAAKAQLLLVKENMPRNGIGLLRAALLVLALALILVGVFNGSARDVFGKAVKVCMECVGLG